MYFEFEIHLLQKGFEELRGIEISLIFPEELAPVDNGSVS